MTSIKPVLNYRPDKDGRHALLLQVIHDRHRGAIFTPYRLLPTQFDKSKERAVMIGKSRKEHEFVGQINGYITAQINELRGVVDELTRRGSPFSVTEVTHTYRHRCDRRYLHTYIEGLCTDLEQQGRHGTARNYRSTLSALERFMGHDRCRFEEVTTPFLADFENSLKRDGKRRNTTTFYLRVLRAIYNKARRDRVVETPENPFDTVSFREDKTRKLAVDDTVLRRLAEAADLPPHLNLARDLFLFSFYARGMSFVDMAYLRQNQIQNGMLRYNRRKTGQPFSVRITPPMEAILNRYNTSAPWAFPLMGEECGAGVGTMSNQSDAEIKQCLHRSYANSLSRQTRYLEQLSTLLGLESKLSFNAARHSWASLARSRGIPVSIISGGLGHASEKTTNIYLDELDNDRLDEANDIITKL